MSTRLSAPKAKALRVLVQTVFLLAASVLSAQVPEGWKAVSPGFSAEVLLIHNNAMWAAGSNESIAVSTDSGGHWTNKHATPGGSLFLSFAFVGDEFGYTAGTGGVVAFTQDGGANWTAKQIYPGTIFQAAFGDSEHGVIRTRDSLLTTQDGGKTWKPVVPVNYNDWTEKSPFTDSVAALDASHLMVRVSEGQYGSGVFLWTGDGGATWTANYLPDGAGAGPVFIADGHYWSVGHQVVGKDKPGGGLAVPMAVISSDGISWEHQLVYSDACHWHGCGGCTPQGCFSGQSSFVPFPRILQSAAGNDPASNPATSSVKPDSLYRFPSHLLSRQWARSADTLCISTRGEIECTKLTPVATLDTKAEPFDYDDDSYPPLHPTRAGMLSGSIESALGHEIRCIRCDLGKSYFSEKGPSGPTALNLSFVIGVSGRPERIQVAGSIPDDVAAKIRQEAHSWLFEPHVEHGVTKPVPISLSGKIFIMNFSNPVH
jgi:hypothetical protein